MTEIVINRSLPNPKSTLRSTLSSKVLEPDQGIRASWIQAIGSVDYPEDRLLQWRNSNQQLFILLDGTSAPSDKAFRRKLFPCNGKEGLSGGQLVGESVSHSLEKLKSISGGLGELLARINDNLCEDLTSVGLGGLSAGERPAAVGAAVLFNQVVGGHTVEICTWGDALIGVELHDFGFITTRNYRANHEQKILDRIREFKGNSKENKGDFWEQLIPELIDFRNQEYNKINLIMNGDPKFGERISAQTEAFLPGSVRRILMMTDGAFDFDEIKTKPKIDKALRKMLSDTPPDNPIKAAIDEIISKHNSTLGNSTEFECAAWIIDIL